MSHLARILALAVFTGSLLAACGGDDGDATDTPAGTATETATSPATLTAEPATSTPTPLPTDTPSPSPTPATTPVAQGLIEHGPRDSGRVALTFDMGGRVDPALDIMQFLIDNSVPATIFMTGAMAENPNTDAGRQVLALICEYPAQFEPGNHSYTHTDFRELTAEQMADELDRTENAMRAYCERDPKPLFRPPMGGVDQDVVAGVTGAGYPYVIMWDVDTIDWLPEAEGGPAADDIVAKVLENAEGGSIVLMHLGGYNTLEALPEIVGGLRDRGYTLVTVRAMLGLPAP